MMTSTKAKLAETNAEQNDFTQRKQTHSSAGGMILLLSIWLVGTAVLALGVVWSTQFMKNATQVAQAPKAKRFKITQAPPQKLPRQPITDSVESQPSETPAPGISSLEETPSQQSVKAQPVEAQSIQADAPADKAGTKEHIGAPPDQPRPVKTKAPTPPQEAPDAAALKKTPAPMESPTDLPVDSNPAQEKVDKIQPEEDTLPDTADSAPSQPAAAQPATDKDAGTVRFNLQVGAFRKEANARDTMEKFSKNGYDSFIFKAPGPRQRIWHTVRIGRYNSYQEAASSLERFMEKENITALVVEAGKL